MTVLQQLIAYHQKKRDWFKYNKDMRAFHEAALAYLQTIKDDGTI